MLRPRCDLHEPTRVIKHTELPRHTPYRRDRIRETSLIEPPSGQHRIQLVGQGDALDEGMDSSHDLVGIDVPESAGQKHPQEESRYEIGRWIPPCRTKILQEKDFRAVFSRALSHK